MSYILKTKITTIINGCGDIQQVKQTFNKALSFSVDIEKMSDSQILDVHQCFMKKYAIDINDNRLYQYWRDCVKRGVM